MNVIQTAAPLREGIQTFPAVVRQDARQIFEQKNTEGYFTRDRFRVFDPGVFLNELGLERNYGRFLTNKIYALRPVDTRGSLISIYV